MNLNYNLLTKKLRKKKRSVEVEFNGRRIQVGNVR